MVRTNKDRVLDYLRLICLEEATSGGIRRATGVEAYQQGFHITQELREGGLIRGEHGTRALGVTRSRRCHVQIVDEAQL